MSDNVVESKLNDCLDSLEEGMAKLQNINAKIHEAAPTDRDTLAELQVNAASLLRQYDGIVAGLPKLLAELIKQPDCDQKMLIRYAERMKPIMATLVAERKDTGEALMKIKKGRSSISAYKQARRY